MQGSCCHIPDGLTPAEGCPEAAVWEATNEDPSEPYDATLGCAPHIGLLLEDGKAYRVTPWNEAGHAG